MLACSPCCTFQRWTSSRSRQFSSSALNCNDCINVVRVFKARFLWHNHEYVPRNDWQKSEIADYCSAAATLTLSTCPIWVRQKSSGFLHHNQDFKGQYCKKWLWHQILNYETENQWAFGVLRLKCRQGNCEQTNWFVFDLTRLVIAPRVHISRSRRSTHLNSWAVKIFSKLCIFAWYVRFFIFTTMKIREDRQREVIARVDRLFGKQLLEKQ